MSKFKDPQYLFFTHHFNLYMLYSMACMHKKNTQQKDLFKGIFLCVFFLLNIIIIISFLARLSITRYGRWEIKFPPFALFIVMHHEERKIVFFFLLNILVDQQKSLLRFALICDDDGEIFFSEIYWRREFSKFLIF